MVQALHVGKNALIVNQSALSVVSNNIANMNTEGYSKQRVNLESLVTTTPATNTYMQAQAGFGVDIASISRYRDVFLDSYYRDVNSSKNYYDTISTKGLIVENISNEFNNTGLSTYINEFFSAANTVSLHPTDETAKTDFAQKASNLATVLNNVSTQLENARTTMVGDINNTSTIYSSEASTYVDTINQLLNDLTNVNKSIIYQHSTNMGSSSGLLDQRDALLDQLSQYIPITVSYNINDGVNVYCGDTAIIAGTDIVGKFKVNVGDEHNPTVISFEKEDGYVFSANMKENFGKNGKLAALLTLGSDSDSELSINYILNNLNKIASAMATEVNAVQKMSEGGIKPMASACYNSSTGQLELATEDIFTTSDGSTTFTAKNICVNQEILSHPQKIATAYVEIDEFGKIIAPDEIGNNAIAQAFSDLREKNISDLGGLTFDNFNTTITTDFGSKLNNANINFETQSNVFTATNEERESTIGVNLEEELMDLIKFQRAYEASARVFNAADDLLKTLVNLAR